MNIRLLGKTEIYSYLWDNYIKGKRTVISRFGDGEYLIMQRGARMKKKIATHVVTDRLTDLLRNSIKIKGQFLCMPMKLMLYGGIDSEEGNDDSRVRAGRYIIENSGHNIFGHDAWRRIDIEHKFHFLTEFFIGKTLVVTGNHVECKKAFEANNVDVDILTCPETNAFSQYDRIKDDLLKKCKEYDNIIFALGPTTNILIADLVGVCKANMLDIGGLIGVLANPYSENEMLVKKWTGFSRKSSIDIISRLSKTFFKSLKEKVELYEK